MVKTSPEMVKVIMEFKKAFGEIGLSDVGYADKKKDDDNEPD